METNQKPNQIPIEGTVSNPEFEPAQGCISCGPCSCPELTEDHVLPSAYVEIFRTVTRNAVNKSFWRKKDCSWPPLNKYAMNIWLSSLRIRAHLSWRTGKHLHVLHVLRTYSTCSYPGYQDTTTYAALWAKRGFCIQIHVYKQTALHDESITFNEINVLLTLFGPSSSSQ